MDSPQTRPTLAGVIAVDGPGAVGKTTVGRALAERLGYRFIDTGVMYRAVTVLALEAGVDTNDDDALTDLAKKCRPRPEAGARPRGIAPDLRR